MWRKSAVIFLKLLRHLLLLRSPIWIDYSVWLKPWVIATSWSMEIVLSWLSGQHFIVLRNSKSHSLSRYFRNFIIRIESLAKNKHYVFYFLLHPLRYASVDIFTGRRALLFTWLKMFVSECKVFVVQITAIICPCFTADEK